MISHRLCYCWHHRLWWYDAVWLVCFAGENFHEFCTFRMIRFVIVLFAEFNPESVSEISTELWSCLLISSTLIPCYPSRTVLYTVVVPVLSIMTTVYLYTGHSMHAFKISIYCELQGFVSFLPWNKAAIRLNGNCDSIHINWHSAATSLTFWCPNFAYSLHPYYNVILMFWSILIATWYKYCQITGSLFHFLLRVAV